MMKATSPSALISDIEARLLRGETVSQDDFDRVAASFPDEDDELVAPEPPVRARGSLLSSLIREAFESEVAT